MSPIQQLARRQLGSVLVTILAASRVKRSSQCGRLPKLQLYCRALYPCVSMHQRLSASNHHRHPTQQTFPQRLLHRSTCYLVRRQAVGFILADAQAPAPARCHWGWFILTHRRPLRVSCVTHFRSPWLHPPRFIGWGSCKPPYRSLITTTRTSARRVGVRSLTLPHVETSRFTTSTPCNKIYLSCILKNQRVVFPSSPVTSLAPCGLRLLH